ncbi:unnamed protein product, partial [Mycena citricolor]
AQARGKGRKRTRGRNTDCTIYGSVNGDRQAETKQSPEERTAEHLVSGASSFAPCAVIFLARLRRKVGQAHDRLRRYALLRNLNIIERSMESSRRSCIGSGE